MKTKQYNVSTEFNIAPIKNKIAKTSKLITNLMIIFGLVSTCSSWADPIWSIHVINTGTSDVTVSIPEAYNNDWNKSCWKTEFKFD